MSKDVFADRFTSLRWPYQSQVVRYVRSVTGSDLNDGASPATAWQTLEHALQSFAIVGVNHQWVIDLGSGVADTAGVFATPNALNLGGVMLGGINFSLDFAATGPDNFASHAMCQIRSSPIQVADPGPGPLGPLTITGSVADPTTLRRTITVAENLTAGAHVGRLLLGSGLGEWTRIVSNTLHDIVCTTSVDPATFTAPVTIYEEGAIIRSGDPAEVFEQAAYLMNLSEWQFTGIAFESTADSKSDALSVYANAPLTFWMCKFAGLTMWNGPGNIIAEACDVHDHFWGHNGAECQWANSLFRSTAPRFHGSSPSGTNSFTDCTMVGLGEAVGFGNVASRWSAHLDRCDVSGSAGDGVRFSFGNSRITNSNVHNNGKDAVYAEKHAWVDMNTVIGAANAGVGLRAESGAQVDANACTVTGGGGDIILGAAGVIAWGAVPATDVGAPIPQFVRVY